MPIRIECCLAFDYARASHHTAIVPGDSKLDALSLTSPTYTLSIRDRQQEQRAQQQQPKKALFDSKDLTLDLRYAAEGCPPDGDVASVCTPVVLQKLDLNVKGHKGEGVCCDSEKSAGQAVTFVLRIPPQRQPRLRLPAQQESRRIS